MAFAAGDARSDAEAPTSIDGDSDGAGRAGTCTGGTCCGIDVPACDAARNPITLFVKRTMMIYSQLTRSEISGSLGDLGTLIPLLVALARQRSVLLAPALFFAGISNIITGYKWDVPMCVQPMKSIAAVALAESWNRESVAAAGITTGGLIFVIGVTNLIELINVIVPSNVVSGIQIGVGFRLASKGILWVAELPWLTQPDCILLAAICSAMCLYWLREMPAGGGDDGSPSAVGGSRRRARHGEDEGTWRGSNCAFTPPVCLSCVLPRLGHPHPVGIYLFLIGAAFAAVELATADNSDGRYDLPLRLFGAPVAVWSIGAVTAADWRLGFFDGSVPQIPLTTLNSVISVCALAHNLYPEKRRPNRSPDTNDSVITRRETSISVGLMNLIFCPFGSMPNCHGAGGLAGQHRLGARHGASVVFLGICKVLLSVFFGASALTLLDAVPASVLGVMLAIAGQELATTGFTLLVASVEREHEEAAAAEAEAGSVEGRHRPTITKKLMLRRSSVVATVTAMVTVATGKTSYGALSGLIAHLIYGDGFTDFAEWTVQQWAKRRRRRSRMGTFPPDGIAPNGGESVVEHGALCGARSPPEDTVHNRSSSSESWNGSGGESP